MNQAEDLRNPILPGRGASDYERYLRTDELLALQKKPQELLHKDELTFQVVHQSSELLLKGAAFELERAAECLRSGDYLTAARLIRRANSEIEHPIGLLHILETITPYDYHIIRSGLGHGSGLDSPGFLALLHIGPQLGQAFDQQLHAAGLTVDGLYRRHADFFGLHDVAERLLDFDERVQLFRFHHLKLAERTSGGQWLARWGLRLRFYMSAWSIFFTSNSGTCGIRSRRTPIKQARRAPPLETSVVAKRGGSAVSLCAERQRLTAYSERTLLGKRHSIDCLGAKCRIIFTKSAFERLFDCVMNHGHKEASTRFTVDSKTIYLAIAHPDGYFLVIEGWEDLQNTPRELK